MRRSFLGRSAHRLFRGMTSALMTRPEMIAALVAMGVARPAAEQAADDDLAKRGVKSRETRFSCPQKPRTRKGVDLGVEGGKSALAGPERPEASHGRAPDSDIASLSLVVPWSRVVSDNKRHTGRNRSHGVEWVTKFALCVETMEAQCADLPTITVPVMLVGRVWFPDARRRDAGNLRKFVTDALQKAEVVVDDALCLAETWVACGVDRANPRIEIRLTTLPHYALTGDRLGVAAHVSLRMYHC